MAQWEYKVYETPLDEGELNALGELGWELIFVTAVKEGSMMFLAWTYIFKRQIVNHKVVTPPEPRPPSGKQE